jgi:hypothetical protein
MRARTLVTIVVLLALATTAAAQFRRGLRGGYESRPLRYATMDDVDGSFQFCRAVYRQSSGGDGGSWSVDFPRADQNLSIRLSELTRTPISTQPDGEPNHLLVNFQDPVLFRCPFVMATEVGSLFISEPEAAMLRDYLLKGGFLWVDDFWGEYAWDNFETQIRKVLPSGAYPIVDLPIEHPIFHALMPLKAVPQVPSINFWLGSGGGTSERGRDSADVHARAIVDDHQRVMVFITHNTDIGDAFEREGDSRDYFLRFSVEGYALGVNVLLYAMTH